MILSKKLQDNLEGLGALQSLLPKDWPHRQMESSAEDQRSWLLSQMEKQTIERLRSRFMKNVSKDNSTGCWNWIGAISRQTGYGAFGWMSRMFGGHRFSWVMHRGVIPDGLYVLHDCPCGDNRACVNPAHLWLGTQLDNMRDMIEKGRKIQRRGEDLSFRKLNERDILTIRSRSKSGEMKKEIAKDFPMVSYGLITKIARGKRWSWLK